MSQKIYLLISMLLFLISITVHAEYDFWGNLEDSSAELQLELNSNFCFDGQLIYHCDR